MAKGDGLKAAADQEAEKAEADASEAEKKSKKSESDSPQIWGRTANQQEIARAEGVLQNLRNRAQDMGPEAVVDALLQVVDVHPELKVPTQWPGKTEDTLLESPYLEDIGTLLLRGCSRLEISPARVVWLWRNKKTWTKNGVQVRADARKLGEIASFVGRGKVVAIVANYPLFRLLNTRQRIAAIYAALRKVDAEGNVKAPQFIGFFDEIQLFGTGTNESDIHLKRALEQGTKRDAQLPFAFPPMSAGNPEGVQTSEPQKERATA
ncbi:MAG: hypothetical protein AB7G12_17535 [Thermoanaerobaculia bacterium]